MSGVLPWMLALLGVAALGATLLALWRSLRAAFGVVELDAAGQISHTEQRAGLLDEKRALLQSIKDLEFERDVGKISEADFERLNGKLRTRAREVYRLLDEDLKEFRQEAEQLIAERLKNEKATVPYRESAPDAPDAGRSDDRPAASGQRIECASCRTDNDPDAAFCKKCGAALGDDDPRAGAVAATTEPEASRDAVATGDTSEAGPAPRRDDGEER